jgi:hypothetical protein
VRVYFEARAETKCWLCSAEWSEARSRWRLGWPAAFSRSLQNKRIPSSPPAYPGGKKKSPLLLAQDFKYKEVATKLDLTERTVKSQMARSSTGCNSGIAARSFE